MKKYSSARAIIILMMSTVFLGACGPESQPKDSPETQAVAEEAPLEFNTLEDRFSYAYGADLAEKFKAEGIELNVTNLAAGMQDAFSGGEMEMSDGEVIATLELYQKVFIQKKEEKMAAAGVKNLAEGEVFLAENATKEGVVVTESGLQYKVITPGDGGYKPTVDDEVKVHYRARFIDGTEFDSTYTRGEPYSVNAKMLIDGWGEALQLMTKGAKWELYIPAELAYGDLGSDPYVGPNAVLIFVVELLDIEKVEKID